MNITKYYKRNMYQTEIVIDGKTYILTDKNKIRELRKLKDKLIVSFLGLSILASYIYIICDAMFLF